MSDFDAMFGFGSNDKSGNARESLWTNYDVPEGQALPESIWANYNQETPLRALAGKRGDKSLAHEYGNVRGHWKQSKKGMTVTFTRRIPILPNLYINVARLEELVASLDPDACKKEGTVENIYAKMLADVKKDVMRITPFNQKTKQYGETRDLPGASELVFRIPEKQAAAPAPAPAGTN